MTYWRRALAMPTALAVVLAGPMQSSWAQGTKASRAEEGFTLAFVDADVRRVADAVFGAMLGADYSVDPAVTGNVTLRTARAVGKNDLLPLFEQALAPLDAVIVLRGGSYNVVLRKDAVALAPPLAAGNRASGPSIGSNTATSASPANDTPGFASEIVTLRYASAKEMARVLEEFLGKDIVSSRNDALNQLVVAGTSEERKAARQIVERFDIDSLAQMNYEIYRLSNVDAVILMSELQKIFAPPYDIIGSRVRLIPLPRLGSLMAIASDRADLARIEPWIRKLDVGTSGTRKLYTYVVQNGRAKDLAQSLQQVMGSSGGSFGSESLGGGGDATPSQASGGGAGATGGSRGASSAAADPGPSPAMATSGGSGGSSGVRIVPNDTNNSLLIYADGEEYALIKDALDQLDQPVAQVLIEATLAEVTLGNDLRYGVDFSMLDGDTRLSSISNASGNPAASFPGLSVSVVRQSATAILNTLQSKTNVRVLSAPKLFVLNNQTASLQVGDQVPIVTQQAQGVSAPGAPIVNTVELRDTGVILQVTPRVNQSGVVTLDITQEVSDVARTTSSGINSPTIQQRKLSSTISTRSGQVVALGGLIRERASNGRSGVPFLSQIPILGAAFGSHTQDGSRTELIILIKPTVIRAPDEVKNVVDALIDGLDLSRPLVDKARAKEVVLPLPGGALPAGTLPQQPGYTPGPGTPYPPMPPAAPPRRP